MQHLEELKGSALFQLLEHGSQVPPAAPGLLNICLVLLPSKQRSRGICKVGLEWEQLLNSTETHISSAQTQSLQTSSDLTGDTDEQVASLSKAANNQSLSFLHPTPPTVFPHFAPPLLLGLPQCCLCPPAIRPGLPAKPEALVPLTAKLS